MRRCFNRPPLFFRCQEYYQPTILKISSASTEPAIKSRRCLSITSTIAPTAKILRTLTILRALIILLIMCGKTVLLPMIDLNCYRGYHPWMPAYGIATSKSAVSTMSGNGLWGLRNLEDGADLVGKVGAMREFCSAMETQGSARHLFGNKDYSPERSESVLTSRGDSSLVVGWLYECTGGQHTVVACFYFDFVARREQTATCILW